MVNKKTTKKRKINKDQYPSPEYDYCDGYDHGDWYAYMSPCEIVFWCTLIIILSPLIISFLIAIVIYFRTMDHINKQKGGEQNGKQKR